MTLDRRTFIAATGAAVLAPQISSAATGATMRARATAFVAALDRSQSTAAQFAWDSRDRTRWNFMLGSNAARGLALEQMTARQKVLAMDLLASGTSALGLQKAEHIMLQQDILRDEWGKGSADRNRERFSVQIFGTPSPDAPWAWRWEGHHLSLSFTLQGDQVISWTPSAFSSEPNVVPSGPHAGLVVLKEEEALARALYQDLTGASQRAALVWEASPGNIRSTNGREADLQRERAGIALGDLSQSQSDMVTRLVEVYTQEVLPSALATDQSARLAREDQAAWRFAWGGANLDGSIYYRITGDALLIEFATLRNQPQHLHAVFHDITHNFGAGSL